MKSTYPTAEMKELFHAIRSIRSQEEAAYFFRDLLTLPEIEEFANRWQIVKRLVRKESYLKISKEIKVSTTTVSRVAHWLKSGMGGYAAVSKRIFSS